MPPIPFSEMNVDVFEGIRLSAKGIKSITIAINIHPRFVIKLPLKR